MTGDFSDVSQVGVILLTLGGLFLLGLTADIIGRNTFLPRVTLLLFAGFLAGPGGFDLIPEFRLTWFPVLTDIAFAMIGFLLGGKLVLSELRRNGGTVIKLSFSVALLSLIVVFGGLFFAGVTVQLALLLGGIAIATDPIATVAVAREMRAKGKFTSTLLGMVAVDDAWGLLIFGFILAAAGALQNGAFDPEMVLSAVRDLAGAIALGVLVGIPAALLTGRIRSGEPTQAEALGVVLLTAGLAILLGVSQILAAMVLGAVIANVARHHSRPFRAIRGLEWPFLTLFFLLAGASFRIDALLGVGWLGVGFILFRIAGRYLGAQCGGWLCGLPPQFRHYMGLALLPQAGVAMGMSLLAAQQFPELSDSIITVVLAATVLFELIGPIATRMALLATGEARGSRL